MDNEDRKNTIARREFLERLSTGALGAAGIAMGLSSIEASAAQAKLERRNEQPEMVYRPLGRTNLNVSRLSFGCIALQDDRLPALEMAVERGVNLVHVCSGYNRGRAIRALGKFLKKPGNRDKVWIMLKHVSSNIDDKLRILNTDHIDIICAPITRPDRVRKSEHEREKFEKLKAQGKVRFLNLTTHGNMQQCMEAALDVGWYSSLLPVIDLTNIERMRPTLQRAARQNVGVVAMKILRKRPPDGEKGIVRTLFAAGVASILKTMNSRREVERWIETVTTAPQEPSRSGVAGLGDCEEGVCSLCGLCEDCPNGVAIQEIVLGYTYYYQQLGWPEIAAERYREIAPRATALSCRDCGRCEQICPNGVPVRTIIREAHKRLSAVV